MKVKDIADFLSEQKGITKLREQSRKDMKAQRDKLVCSFDNENQAIAVLTRVMEVTQEGTTEFIRNTVTTALQYVYGEEYGFDIDFNFRYNQPEISFYPTKGGVKYDPRNSCGIGLVDVCSFALRMSLWALQENRTSPIIICDEPFKNLHGVEQNERVGMMIRKLSEMLHLQVIMVSGEVPVVNYADKVFMVKQVDGVSIVTEVH